MPSTVTEAYRVISQGLLEGYKELGLDAYFAIPKSKEERKSLNNLGVQYALMLQVGMNW